jgi:hypothetical protein
VWILEFFSTEVLRISIERERAAGDDERGEATCLAFQTRNEPKEIPRGRGLWREWPSNGPDSG